MTIVETVYKTADEQQIDKHNQSGPHVLRKTYIPSAGINWAVIGCVVDAAFDKDTDEAALITALEALSEITNVVNPRLYGETDATIPTNYEMQLIIESYLTMTVGTGQDLRSRKEQEIEILKPGNNKKWLVLNLVIPDPLDATKIATLESAMEGLSQITTAEHAIDGSIRSDAIDIALTITTRTRLEYVEP